MREVVDVFGCVASALVISSVLTLGLAAILGGFASRRRGAHEKGFGETDLLFNLYDCLVL